eukprot:scaffold36274_cov125-Isochrysis_galbana.AAC.18
MRRPTGVSAPQRSTPALTRALLVGVKGRTRPGSALSLSSLYLLFLLRFSSGTNIAREKLVAACLVSSSSRAPVRARAAPCPKRASVPPTIISRHWDGSARHPTTPAPGGLCVVRCGADTFASATGGTGGTAAAKRVSRRNLQLTAPAVSCYPRRASGPTGSRAAACCPPRAPRAVSWCPCCATEPKQPGRNRRSSGRRAASAAA